jgi:hypothetical protein
MAKTIALINKGTDYFDTWINRTNELANVVTQEVLTANTNANGAFVTGNSFLYGIFGANTLTVFNTLRGGNVQTSNTLYVTSNLYVNSSSMTVGNSTVNTVANGTAFVAANAALTAVLAYTGLLVSGNVGANATHFYVGNSTANVTSNSSAVLLANSTGLNTTVSPGTFLLGNSIANTFANNALVKVANATGTANLTPLGLVVGTSVVNSTLVAAGANVLLGVADLRIGNSTVNALANSILVQVANSTASANHSVAGFVVGTSVVNSTVFYTGTNGFTANATAARVGNSTANVVITYNTTYAGNSTSNSTQNSAGFYVGTSVVNSTLIAAGANVLLGVADLKIGNITINVFSNSSTILLGGNAGLNQTTLFVGNSTVNTVVNSSSISFGGNLVANNTTLKIGNSSVNVVVNSSIISISGSPIVTDATKMTAAWNGTEVGSQRRINFVAGNNVFLNVTSNTENGQINVQINAVATSGSGIVQGTDMAVQYNDNMNFGGDAAKFAFNTTTSVLTVANTIVANVHQLSQGVVMVANAASYVDSVTPNTIDAFRIDTFRTVDYVYSIKNDSANAYQGGRLVVINDGTGAQLEEYGVGYTNTLLGLFSTSANDTHILLQFTPGSILTYTCKSQATRIPV